MAARRPAVQHIRTGGCSACDKAAIARQRWKAQVQQEFKEESPKFRVPKRGKRV